MTETNSVRTRRSPQEILAAKEWDLINAKARAAVDAQMNHPSVQAITSILADNAKARTDAKKGYNGNPNQTFANRTKSHSLWISEIEAEKDQADAQIALSDYISPLYRTLRNQVATMLANGQDVAEFVTNEHRAIEDRASGLYAELSLANGNMEAATAARKAFVASRKATATVQAQATV